MAITVGPTYNDATGEYGEQQVSYTMHHGSNVPVALEEAQDEAYAPFEPDKYSNDAAFGDNPTEAELNAFWASDRPITPDEISIIQDHIQKLGFDSDEGRRLGRFLNYRVTGNSDELFDDDKLALNIQPPDPNVWTTEETEQYILSDLPEKGDRPDLAQYISENRPLGNSPAAITVQHFAAQYLMGRMSNQQAFAGAFQSGVPHAQLYAAFEQLTDLFEYAD